MVDEEKINVVLCWHMHQPEYRDTCGNYQLPWTYLHAIKDYVDMAAILEENPEARAVINFVPILLEQIADYADQVATFLKSGKCIRDPLLAALDMPSLPVTEEERKFLIKACLRANRERLIDSFPPFKRLADMAVVFIEKPASMVYLDEQFLVDIMVWYHIAWLGETVRRNDTRVKALIKKGGMFSLKDRRQLLEIINELLGNIINRYRALEQRGQIELSMTPYAHPMAPLLIDFGSARESLPDSPLPRAENYPGGAERVHWHVKEGFKIFKHFFGIAPKGCWPAEGGISDSMLEVFSEFDISWIASGQNVFQNSIAKSKKIKADPEDQTLHSIYRYNKGPACYFRDDGLSDLIGFTYADWHGDDAVANFVHHLENIADHSKDKKNCVVSIILDGENAWEYYPNNGYYFLSALYKQLAEHPRINLTTFSDCLDNNIKVNTLPAVTAGSWVHGTFATWMGNEDKNKGWDLLCEAKLAFDKAFADGNLSSAQKKNAMHQLAICEGSDWFWWFGDYNPSESVSDFDHLYRMHLSSLYQMIGQDPPENLTHIISHGGGRPQKGGVMRAGQAETS